MKKNFRIDWDDPKTGERRTEEDFFEDTPQLTAYQLACDHAYMKADKGWFLVTDLSAIRSINGGRLVRKHRVRKHHFV